MLDPPVADVKAAAKWAGVDIQISIKPLVMFQPVERPLGLVDAFVAELSPAIQETMAHVHTSCNFS